MLPLCVNLSCHSLNPPNFTTYVMSPVSVWPVSLVIAFLHTQTEFLPVARPPPPGCFNVHLFISACKHTHFRNVVIDSWKPHRDPWNFCTTSVLLHPPSHKTYFQSLFFLAQFSFISFKDAMKSFMLNLHVTILTLSVPRCCTNVFSILHVPVRIEPGCVLWGSKG